MLFAILEISFKYLPVWPDELACPIFTSIFVLTFKNSAISKIKFSFAMHHIFSPISYIASTIWPFIGSKTMEWIFTEISRIFSSIFPSLSSLDLLTTLKLACKYWAIWKCFSSLSFYFTVVEITFKIWSIIVIISSLSTDFIIRKITLIIFPIGMNYSALAVCCVICPTAFI